MFSLSAVLLAIGIWLGSIVFQSAVVAPVVFTSLEPEGARRVLRTLFPRFFRLGIACGAIALLATVFAGSSPLVPGILGVMLLANIAALMMVPAINRASDDGAAGKKRFRLLHGTSVLLTLGVMAGCVAVVFLLIAGFAGGAA